MSDLTALTTAINDLKASVDALIARIPPDNQAQIDQLTAAANLIKAAADGAAV